MQNNLLIRFNILNYLYFCNSFYDHYRECNHMVRRLLSHKYNSDFACDYECKYTYPILANFSDYIDFLAGTVIFIDSEEYIICMHIINDYFATFDTALQGSSNFFSKHLPKMYNAFIMLQQQWKNNDKVNYATSHKTLLTSF